MGRGQGEGSVSRGPERIHSEKADDEEVASHGEREKRRAETYASVHRSDLNSVRDNVGGHAFFNRADFRERDGELKDIQPSQSGERRRGRGSRTEVTQPKMLA